jgi:hypothetical protein
VLPYSVIVDDFDVDRTLRRPFETNALLAVYPDAELTAPIAGKGFEPVAGRRFQIAQFHRGIQCTEPSDCDISDYPKPFWRSAFVKRLSVLASERLYHYVHRITFSVIRQELRGEPSRRLGLCFSRDVAAWVSQASMNCGMGVGNRPNGRHGGLRRRSSLRHVIRAKGVAKNCVANFALDRRRSVR